MARKIAFIGFGEAAKAFVASSDFASSTRAYDKLTDDLASRSAKYAEYADIGVTGSATSAEALEGAEVVLSLVTASNALPAAADAARNISADAIYLDMNSVAPETKRSAAHAIEGAGARYVDVAIMAPVHPARRSVPLLLSGPSALEAERILRELGFRILDTIGPRVGSASAIKMIRSVIVKGIEALTAEAMLAAHEAGIVDQVLNSLDASEHSISWTVRANYNLERMMAHGVRRAEEMEEAARTLRSLGVDPLMTLGTVERQRELGGRGIHPVAGLDAKLTALGSRKVDAA